MKRSFLMVKQKISSDRGESLSELLIAVLIVGLGLAMFASAMVASGRMITESDTDWQEYYAMRNRLEQEEAAAQTKGTLIAEPANDFTKTRISIALPQKGTLGAGIYQIDLYTEQDKKNGAQYYRYSRK